MNRTLSRLLWIIAGVILIISGVSCIMRPELLLYSLSFIFGIAMLFSGVVDIIIFAAGHRRMAGAGWFLVDGVLTTLLSLFILGNQWFSAMTLPLIFGMWLLFSGVTKFVNSFDLQRLGVRGWGWFTALGILLMAAGFLSFIRPIASIAIALIVGSILILQGVGYILRGCFSRRFFM